MENDLLTPLDLRTQTFGMNVELPPQYYRPPRKKNFRAKRLLSDIFSKIFFRSMADEMGIKQFHLKSLVSPTTCENFFEPKGLLSDIFRILVKMFLSSSVL